MSDVAVVSRSLPENGRFLARARNHFLVTDASPSRNGAGDALSAGELFALALASCASSSVEFFAGEIVDGAVEVESAVTTTSQEGKPTELDFELVITLTGVSAEQAEGIVASFTATCPVYNTIARGARVVVTTVVR